MSAQFKNLFNKNGNKQPVENQNTLYIDISKQIVRQSSVLMPSATELTACKSPLQVALCWTAHGFPVFPCKESPILDANGKEIEGAKKPYISGGFKSATTDQVQIQIWWQKFPGALIGLPLGPNTGLIVIDPDRHGRGDGVANFNSLLVEHDIKIDQPGPMAITQSGGHHHFFIYPNRPEGHAKELTDCVDIKGKGGYVITAGSKMADGAAYSWVENRDPASCVVQSMPPALEALVFKNGKIKSTPSLSLHNGPSIREIESALTYIPAETYEDWRVAGMSLKSQLGESGYSLWYRWSQSSPKFKAGEMRRIWDSYKGEGITIASLFDIAKKKWGESC